MSRHVVNWRKLVDALDMACEIRGVSLRAVALEIGISPSGLSRLRRGDHLEADALASLVAWLFPSSIPLWITTADPSPREAPSSAASPKDLSGDLS